MDFGRVDTADLASIDFKLPPDPASNRRVLPAAKKKRHPSVYMGCAKWGRADWIGKIYPKGTKPADFLQHYAKYFSSIELNATFYQLWDEKTIGKWVEKVGEDFRFCPKFYQGISHIRRLQKADDWTSAFLRNISAFGKNLGPCFLQLPDNFGPKNMDVLASYLEHLPEDLSVFVEVRNPGWFVGDDSTGYFELLQKLHRGAVITDASGRRDCVHMHLTTPSTFIRFVGNGLHPTDYSRVDDWVDRMSGWLDRGISEIYFFMHQHEELHSPELIKYTIQQINRKCGLQIPEPVFIYDQQLF